MEEPQMLEGTAAVIAALEGKMGQLIRSGIQGQNQVWDEDPAYMEKATDVFVRQPMHEARMILEAAGRCHLQAQDWDQVERILCDKIRDKRFRQKLKKHRQYADAVSMRCVRGLEQMIRFLKEVQRHCSDHDPDDARKKTISQ